jgi:malate dehydrogenase
MQGVAIIGAGALGGALAHALAAADVVRTIRIVDESGHVAAGVALDIAQSSPISGFSTTVTGTADLIGAAGMDVVAVADRVQGGEWQGGDGLRLLQRLTRLAAGSVILCAGAAQRELVERGVRELGMPRERLLGSAPEALAAGLRAIVALEANGSPRDVSLTVLGVPPDHIVVPWEDASIGGFAATRALDGAARRRMAARVRLLWPPGPLALAAAAAQCARGLAGRSRQAVAAFVGPDDSQGRRVRAAALPVRLGSEGIARVELPALTARDRVALDNAMLL